MEIKPILQEFEEFSIEWHMVLHWQATRKEERKSHLFSILIEIALLCQKKVRYTDSVYSKDTLGTLLKISMKSQLISIYWSHLSQNLSPLLLYMNMWSSACLEAGENVLLLILLPVFDTGSFITNLYLPHLLDELRGLVIRQHGFSFLFWYRFGSPRPNEYFTESRLRIPLNKVPFFFFGTTRWI